MRKHCPSTKWSCRDLYIRNTFPVGALKSCHPNLPLYNAINSWNHTGRLWIPYDIRGDVIQTALKSALFASQRPLPPSYQRSPRILVLTKGTPKIWLLDALIPAEGIFENILIRDVADYGCPPAQQLFGHRAGTDVNFCIVPFPLFSELFSFLSFS